MSATLFCAGLANTSATVRVCTAYSVPSLAEYPDANALGPEVLPGQRTVIDTTLQGVVFSPNGQWMMITNTTPDAKLPTLKAVSVFDLESGTGVVLSGSVAVGGPYPGTFNPSSSRCVIGDNSSPYMQIFDTATWTQTTVPSLSAAAIWSAYSPDGAKLAVLTWTGNRLRVFNTADWSEITIPVNITTTVYQCAFSPDGTSLLVVHASSPYVSVYDTTTWAKTAFAGSLPPTNTGQSVAFSADGLHLAIGASSSPYIYHYSWPGLDKKNPDYGVQTSNPVTGVALSPDGAYLAAVTSSSSSGSLTIWDTTTTPFNTRLTLPTSMLNLASQKAVAFAPAYINNTLSATASYPVLDEAGSPAIRTIRAYSRETGKHLGSTTSAADGSYSIGPLLSKTPATIVYLDDAAGAVLNDLAIRAVPG